MPTWLTSKLQPAGLKPCHSSWPGLISPTIQPRGIQMLIILLHTTIWINPSPSSILLFRVSINHYLYHSVTRLLAWNCFCWLILYSYSTVWHKHFTLLSNYLNICSIARYKDLKCTAWHKDIGVLVIHMLHTITVLCVHCLQLLWGKLGANCWKLKINSITWGVITDHHYLLVFTCQERVAW